MLTPTNSSSPVGPIGPGQEADIKAVKRLNRAIKVARFSMLTTRVLWAFARYYPAAFVAAALIGVLLAIIAPLLLPLVVVVLLGAVALQVRWEGSRARVDVAAAVVLVAVFRWRWASQMQRAELDRLIRGRQRVPRITSCNVQTVTWRWAVVPSVQRMDIEIQPLDTNKPEEWPEIARRIQTRYGFAAHSYQPNGETRFRVAYANQVLPDYATFNANDWVRWAKANPTAINLGYTGNLHAPEPWMTWELDAFPHLMINGKTGGGKSTPQRLAQAHAALHGGEQIVLSGKRSGEFGWARDQGLASVVSTPPGWAEAATFLWVEFNRRQALLEESGFEWWWEHPNIGHRIFVFVDELMLVTGAVVKDDLTDYRSYTAARLTELAAAARSCGIHLVMVTQYGIAQSAGNTGSLMRFNLSARMVVGHSNGDGLKAAFDEPVPEHLANHVKGVIPGRCLYGQLNRHHGAHVTPGQVWNITQAEAAALSPTEPAHLPIAFDAMGEAQLLADLDQPQTNNRKKRSRR